jgi:glutaredoxin 3
MRSVTVYTTNVCPYCVRAKQVLNKHRVPFTEIDVSGDDEKRRWLLERTGQRTVPQIFFDDESMGGCTDLEALVARGELDARLQRK